MSAPTTRLLLGKAEDRLAEIEPDSVHALVTDPPAGISFMGKDWDSAKGGRDAWVSWMVGVMEQVLRVLKPGAHGLVWALPRTSHWTATALENAGFEIRDVLMHVFGSGLPKNLDVSKAIDAAAGAERDLPRHSGWSTTPGTTTNTCDRCGRSKGGQPGNCQCDKNGEPITPDAQRRHGWGTALKPAAEHWILVRKPLAGTTVAANVLEHGTGGINVEACRVEGTPESTRFDPAKHSHDGWRMAATGAETAARAEGASCRWPPHLLLSHSPDCAERCVEGCPVRVMDEQSGERPVSGSALSGHNRSDLVYDEHRVAYGGGLKQGTLHADSGGASRFFPRFRYLSKPSTTERNAGCEGFYWRRTKTGFDLIDKLTWDYLPEKERAHGNIHPTLKSLNLMRWLCRLITPPGGTVLDPFCGSGTTGMATFAEGFSFIGVEQDHDYMALAQARIEWASSQTADVEGPYQRPKPQPGQVGLF